MVFIYSFFLKIYTVEKTRKMEGKKEKGKIFVWIQYFISSPLLLGIQKKKSIITCRIWFNGVVSDIWAYHTVCMIKNAHIGGVLGARFFEKVYLNRYFFNFSLFFLLGSSGQNVSQVCFH